MRFYDDLDRDVCVTALQGLHTFGPSNLTDRQNWLKSAVWWLRRLGELQTPKQPDQMWANHTLLANTLAKFDNCHVAVAFERINELLLLEGMWEAPAKKSPKRTVQVRV
jgi:hypothetical protein